MKDLEKLLSNINVTPDSRKQKESLNAILQAQEQSNKTKTAAKQPVNIGILIMKHKLTKLATAAMILIALLLTFNHNGVSPDGATIAWADVVEQFQSMSYYYAECILKQRANSQPKQIELWVAKEGKARLRCGDQVMFLNNGKVISGYDIDRKEKVENLKLDIDSVDLAEMLCRNNEISLDNIVQTVHKGKLSESTPIINPDAMISEDLLVFDIESSHTPEWMRIWVLRESKLPIRFRMWDPRWGESLTVSFTYQNQQEADFFDTNKFEEILNNSPAITGSAKANLAYALLKDPGGKDYLPESLFEKNGYHMPVIDNIGITEYGAVWIIASEAQNRRPDGHTFYGFYEITDNLGRQYRRMSSSWHISDVSSQIFIPEGYPLDNQKPEMLILTCKEEKHHPDEKPKTIGSIEITEWKENSLWPDSIDESENKILIDAAHNYNKNKEFDKLSKTIEIVQNSQDAEKYSKQIEFLNMEIAIKKKEFQKASDLAKKIWTKELEIYLHPRRTQPNPTRLIRCILAIACNKELGVAKEYANTIITTMPDFSAFPERAQKWMTQGHEQRCLESLKLNLYDFFTIAELSLEQINEIVGFDVSQNEETKWCIPQNYR